MARVPGAVGSFSQDVADPSATPAPERVGRSTVPLIVGLVVAANLIGVATVTMLLLGLSGGTDPADTTGRNVLLLVAGALR